jgi:hypothetical protein
MSPIPINGDDVWGVDDTPRTPQYYVEAIPVLWEPTGWRGLVLTSGCLVVHETDVLPTDDAARTAAQSWIEVEATQ